MPETHLSANGNFQLASSSVIFSTATMFALRLQPGRLLLLTKQVRWQSSLESNKLDPTSEVKIKELVSAFSTPERRMLYDQLRHDMIAQEIARVDALSKPPSKLMRWLYGTSFSRQVKKIIEKPTSSQLGSLFATYSLPYVAFGCLDNCLMIVAGEYIESTLGSVTGLSTMGSAALGNTLADAASVALAYHVERYFTRQSYRKGTAANISLDQFSLRRTRVVIQLARISGIAIGCLIGMFPLLLKF